MQDVTPLRFGQVACWGGVCFAVALLLTFCLAIEQNPIVDENVFIASAELFGDGMLPYRDFHYNHMPTLMVIYAGLFHLTDHLLLAARTFSAVCAAVTVTVMFVVSLRAFASLSVRRRLIWSGAIAGFFLANPLFTYTAGMAWNHDFAVLCVLLGFLALVHGSGAAGRRALPWTATSGLLLGLAFTTRLTFAPAVVPFAALIVLQPGLTIRRRVALLAALMAGVVVATLPSAWFWAQSISNAWFGNVEYPAFNTRWHFEHDDVRKRPFSVVGRFIYLLKTTITLPANGMLCAAFVALIAMVVRWKAIRTDRRVCELFVIGLLVFLLLAASFAAAPLYRQYLYAAMPFMLLGLIRGLALRPEVFESLKLRRVAVGGLAVAFVFAVDQYDGMAMLFAPAKWPPMQAQRIGDRIAEHTRPGRVLSLEPLYVLEGGRDVYPGLSTGKFGVRAATYLTEQEQTSYVMPDTADLLKLFETDPPVGVFTTDLEEDFDDRLAGEARRRGYWPYVFDKDHTLWVAPERVGAGKTG